MDIAKFLTLIEDIASDRISVSEFRQRAAAMDDDAFETAMAILHAAENGPDGMRNAAIARGWNVPPGWPAVKAASSKPN